MRNLLIGGMVAAALLLGGAFALMRNDALLLDAVALATPDTTLAEHEAFLADHIRMEAAPEGAGDAALPTLVQFHGCSGYRKAFIAHWAGVAARNGWRAISVDSHTPRGIDDETARKTVCLGRELLAQERAGDVIAALNLISKRPDVDPSRIVVAGWSHGAWTLMDLFAMDLSKRSPAALSDGDLKVPTIAGAILVYPHCGRGAWSSVSDWTISPPTLALVAGADTVVNGPQCKALLEELSAQGHDIDIVYYPEADHVFDDASLPKYYSEEEAADAVTKVAAFLVARR
ncbi:MAG: dienelactone hydrolase family protein [Pseudomonadota bacterium]